MKGNVPFLRGDNLKLLKTCWYLLRSKKLKRMWKHPQVVLIHFFQIIIPWGREAPHLKVEFLQRNT